MTRSPTTPWSRRCSPSAAPRALRRRARRRLGRHRGLRRRAARQLRTEADLRSGGGPEPRWPAAAPRHAGAARRRRRAAHAAAQLVEGGLPDTPVVGHHAGLGDGAEERRRQARRGGREDRRTGHVTARSSPTVGTAVDKRARLSWWEQPPAVRLAGAGAAHQGAGRRDERAAARLRRGAGRGADHRRRAAAQPRPDGPRDQGPGHRPLRLDRVHLHERGAAVREKFDRARPGRPRVRRRQGRLRRRADRRRRAGVRHRAGAGARRRAVQRGPAGRLPALRRRVRPDRPGAAAARRHRDRDARRRAQGARLGDRRRHRLPHRAGRAAGRVGPRGDQGRRLRRRLLHLVQHRAQPGRHRRQAARARPSSPCIGPATAASAQEFGLRVDVQPETAAVGPLVDALAAYALSLRESEDGEGK